MLFLTCAFVAHIILNYVVNSEKSTNSMTLSAARRNNMSDLDIWLIQQQYQNYLDVMYVHGSC